MMGYQPPGMNMTAQKRSSSKNYIELVVGEHEQHSAEPPAASVRAIRDYLLELIAAMRKAHRD